MTDKKIKKQVLEGLLSFSDEELEEEMFNVLITSDKKFIQNLQKKYKKQIAKVAKAIDPKKIIKKAEAIATSSSEEKRPEPVLV